MFVHVSLSAFLVARGDLPIVDKAEVKGPKSSWAQVLVGPALGRGWGGQNGRSVGWSLAVGTLYTCFRVEGHFAGRAGPCVSHLRVERRRVKECVSV